MGVLVGWSDLGLAGIDERPFLVRHDPPHEGGVRGTARPQQHAGMRLGDAAELGRQQLARAVQEAQAFVAIDIAGVRGPVRQPQGDAPMAHRRVDPRERDRDLVRVAARNARRWRRSARGAGSVVATGAGLVDPLEGAVARCELPVAGARCAGLWLEQAGVRAMRNAAAIRAPKLRSVNARLRAGVHIVSPYIFCAVYLASPRLITASRWDATMGKGRPPHLGRPPQVKNC